MDKIIARINKFVDDRDWDQFHSPGNLAKSISIEAGELLECYQWNDDSNLENVKEEIADILIYCVQLTEKLNLDILEIMNEKMDKNESKYSVEKSKGSSKKYNEL